MSEPFHEANERLRERKRIENDKDAYIRILISLGRLEQKANIFQGKCADMEVYVQELEAALREIAALSPTQEVDAPTQEVDAPTQEVDAPTQEVDDE